MLTLDNDTDVNNNDDDKERLKKKQIINFLNKDFFRIYFKHNQRY